MKVKIKKLHPNAAIPSYAKTGDAGMDLTAVWKKQELDLITYGTGLAVEIPEGYVGLLFPRSSAPCSFSEHRRAWHFSRTWFTPRQVSRFDAASSRSPPSPSSSRSRVSRSFD